MLLSRFAMTFLLCLAVTTPPVSAQDYPNKPTRIITSSPGSGSDFVARLIAQGITGPLGQPVIVDNRSSNLTGDYAMNAPPDGYNLLVESNSFWLAPLLQTKPYEVLRDFTPVTTVLSRPNIVVVHPSVAANSVSDLIVLVKARPGQLNYSSSGNGSSEQLAMEMLKFMAGGINIVHVSYKGSAPAVTAVVAGEVQMVIASAALVLPQIKAGKLRALAVTSAKPSPILPNLPTVASFGLRDYDYMTITGLFASGKPPQAIIHRLNQEIVRVVNSAETRDRFAAMGVEPVGNTPEEFVAIIKADVARMGNVIKQAHITAD